MRTIRVGKLQRKMTLYSIVEMQAMSCEKFVAAGNDILNGNAMIVGKFFDSDLFMMMWGDKTDPEALKAYRKIIRRRERDRKPNYVQPTGGNKK